MLTDVEVWNVIWATYDAIRNRFKSLPKRPKIKAIDVPPRSWDAATYFNPETDDFSCLEFNFRTLRAAKESDIINLVKHEVAHIVAGRSAGHGKTWKETARKMGCPEEKLAHY